MDTDSEFWDEIADKLVTIYNHQRLAKSDIELFHKQLAKSEAELARLDLLASKYEALFSAPEVEGTPA